MIQAPTFFLPKPTPDTEDTEELYAKFAAACNSSVPSFEKRIFSITFMHDGIEWTATVGETMCGTERKTVRRKGHKIVQEIKHRESAMVLAVFAGNPFQVVINEMRGRWHNPLLA